MFTAFELFSDEQGQAEMYPGAMVFCLSRLHAGGCEYNRDKGFYKYQVRAWRILSGVGRSSGDLPT